MSGPTVSQRLPGLTVAVLPVVPPRPGLPEGSARTGPAEPWAPSPSPTRLTARARRHHQGVVDCAIIASMLRTRTASVAASSSAGLNIRSSEPAEWAGVWPGGT